MPPPSEQVFFARRNVQPPGALFVDGTDVLLVEAQSMPGSPNNELRARILTPGGFVQNIRQAFSVEASGALTTLAVPLPRGYLLGVTVHTDSSRGRGFMFVRCSLARGLSSATTFRYQTLFADQISFDGGTGWPGGRMLDPGEGPGRFRAITGTDPAAGVEIFETVSGVATWHLRALSFTLITSLAAANREVRIILDDGASIFSFTGANSVQTAGQTKRYGAAPGIPAGASSSISSHIPLPVPTQLRDSWRWGTSTVGLQAGDNFGAPVYFVEELSARNA